MNKYSESIEREMLKFYSSLDEAGQRRYAAIESLKLGHGGKKYIKELFSTSYDRISRGVSELSKGVVADGRIRKAGGGRKGKKMMRR